MIREQAKQLVRTVLGPFEWRVIASGVIGGVTIYGLALVSGFVF